MFSVVNKTSYFSQEAGPKLVFRARTFCFLDPKQVVLVPKPMQSISTVFWQERSRTINKNIPKLQHYETSSFYLYAVLQKTNLAKIYSGSWVANASVSN